MTQPSSQGSPVRPKYIVSWYDSPRNLYGKNKNYKFVSKIGRLTSPAKAVIDFNRVWAELEEEPFDERPFPEIVHLSSSFSSKREPAGPETSDAGSFLWEPTVEDRTTAESFIQSAQSSIEVLERIKKNYSQTQASLAASQTPGNTELSTPTASRKRSGGLRMEGLGTPLANSTPVRSFSAYDNNSTSVVPETPPNKIRKVEYEIDLDDSIEFPAFTPTPDRNAKSENTTPKLGQGPALDTTPKRPSRATSMWKRAKSHGTGPETPVASRIEKAKSFEHVRSPAPTVDADFSDDDTVFEI